MYSKMKARVNETYKQHFILLTLYVFILQISTLAFKVTLSDKSALDDVASEIIVAPFILVSFASFTYYAFLKKFQGLSFSLSDILLSLEKLQALLLCPTIIAFFQYLTLYLLKNKTTTGIYIVGTEVVMLVFSMVHLVSIFCIYDYFSNCEYSGDSYIERNLAREEAHRRDIKQILGILSIAIEITYTKWKTVILVSLLGNVNNYV